MPDLLEFKSLEELEEEDYSEQEFMRIMPWDKFLAEIKTNFYKSVKSYKQQYPKAKFDSMSGPWPGYNGGLYDDYLNKKTDEKLGWEMAVVIILSGMLTHIKGWLHEYFTKTVDYTTTMNDDIKSITKKNEILERVHKDDINTADGAIAALENIHYKYIQ